MCDHLYEDRPGYIEPFIYSRPDRKYMGIPTAFLQSNYELYFCDECEQWVSRLGLTWSDYLTALKVFDGHTHQLCTMPHCPNYAIKVLDEVKHIIVCKEHYKHLLIFEGR